MDPRIADYIRDNKRRYTRQAIRQQLIDAGHDPEEIDATWAALGTPDPDSTAGEGFWGRFWIFLIGANVAVFLVVSLLSGMLASGGATVVAGIFAIVLALGALIAWGLVAATGPAKMGRGTALAIGAVIPLVIALLIGGACFALIGGIGGMPPPATSGSMYLGIEPPLGIAASGPATCQGQTGNASGFSVFGDVTSDAGRTANISIDGFADKPESSAQVINMFINLESPDFAASYSGNSDTNAGIQYSASADGLSGSVTFVDLEPEPIERPPGEATPAPISGTVTWTCDTGG
jgi:hypothetical protein